MAPCSKSAARSESGVAAPIVRTEPHPAAELGRLGSPRHAVVVLPAVRSLKLLPGEKPSLRLLAGEPVHRFAEEVGVAVVPRVLLDHVDDDPSQGWCATVGPRAPGRLV